MIRAGARQSKRGRCRRQTGLTLAEVVVATMLVSIVLIGSLNGVGTSLKMWKAAAQRGEAAGLAHQLMSEILQQQYKEPGTLAIVTDLGESLTNRSDWDDVDDYDNWSSAPKYKDGTSIAGYNSWTRAVDVDWVQRDNPHTTSLTETGLKRITVTVTDPAGVTTKLTGWRSNAGVLETPPPADVTVQAWVGSKLTVGGQVALENGTVLVNEPQ